MTSPAEAPAPPDALRLRAKVRSVTRINRKLLLAGGLLGMLGLFAALAVALRPPRALESSLPADHYNTTSKRTPDGLSGLPASYDHWSDDIPKLGPPLSGDLGATIVSEEEEWGLYPEWDVPPTTDFRPSDEEEAIRARRLAEAKLEDQALKASVFFDLRNRPSGDMKSPDTLSAQTVSDLLAFPTRSDTPAAATETNLQASKIAFASSERDAAVYNPHQLETPRSPYQVMSGSLIPAALVTGINSDLPGPIIAQVTQPVYDSITGTVTLIPQGTRLLGRYQSEVSFGQSRALIVWDRILFPDGSSIRMSEPGADKTGESGLRDRTDNHWKGVLAAAGLATLLGIGAEAGNPDGSDLERAIRRGYGDSVSEAGQQIVDRNLSIQPTLRVRPGWPVRVIVTRDLILRPYSGD